MRLGIVKLGVALVLIALATAASVWPVAASPLASSGSAHVQSQATPATASAQAQAIVRAAESWLTSPVTPYCWGGGDDAGPTHGFGEDPAHYGGPKGKSGCYGKAVTGFDCSGLVKYAIYQALHISLYHSAQYQYEGVTDTGSNVHPKIIKVADLAPGDVVVFGSSRSAIGHDGIYVGNGQVVNAFDYKNDGDNGTNNQYWGVVESPLSWAKGGFTFVAGVRYWKTSSGPSPTPSPTPTPTSKPTPTPTPTPTSTPVPSGADDWAQPGHDAARNYDNAGETTVGTANVSRLVQAWSVAANPRAIQPIVYQGEVYRLASTMAGIGTGSDVLSASALSTGKVLWRKSLGGIGLDTLYAAGDGEVLYGAAGSADALVAVSATTGAQLWSTPDASFTGGGGEVLLDGGKIIDGVQNIQVLNAANGHQLWQATDGAGAGGPDAFAVSASRVIRTATIGGKTYLEARGEVHGRLEWTRPAPCTSAQNNVNIAIGGAAIYVHDTCSGTMRAYALRTGALRWKVSDAGSQEDVGLATDGTTVYAVADTSSQAAIWAYAAGKARWHVLLGQATYPISTPTLANGVLYVTVQKVSSPPSTAEVTVALNAATGARLWTSPVLGEIGDTPFVAHGYLLVGAAVFRLG